MAISAVPSLATADDVVARLGRNLNQVEAARIDSLLSDGSGYIRRYCRKDFQLHEDEVLDIRAAGGVIKLPYRPVIDVTSVIALSGAVGVPDVNVTWYMFDHIDEIIVSDPEQSGVINLPEIWYDIGWFQGTYRVTHTWGYSEVPQEVNSLLCQATITVLSTPTMGPLTSETVGAYSYNLRPTGGAGIRAALKDAGMEEILADFRTKQSTIQIASN